MRFEQPAADGERLVEPLRRRLGVAGGEVGVAEQGQRRRPAAEHLLVVRRGLEQVGDRGLDPLQDGAEVLDPHALDVADALRHVAGDVVDRIAGDAEILVRPVRFGIGPLGLGVGPHRLGIGAVRLGGGPLLGPEGEDAGADRDQRDDAEDDRGDPRPLLDALRGVALGLGLAELRRLERLALLLGLPLPLGIGAVGGLDEGGLGRIEAGRMQLQPVLRALEQDAGDQPLVALALGQPLPVRQRALEPVPADQELAFLLEPAGEQRPHPEQRLMGDLDLARPLVLADDEQPGARAGERREEPLRALLRHLVPLAPPGGRSRPRR